MVKVLLLVILMLDLLLKSILLMSLGLSCYPAEGTLLSLASICPVDVTICSKVIIFIVLLRSILTVFIFLGLNIVRAVFRVTGWHAISYEACHLFVHLINFVILLRLFWRNGSIFYYESFLYFLMLGYSSLC